MNHPIPDDHPLLLASDEIATVIVRSQSSAAHTLSPAGFDIWLTGAQTLQEQGRSDAVVVAWLESMPEVARECGEDVLIDCLSAALKMSSMTSGEVIAMTFSSLPSVARNLGDAELLRGYLSFLHRFASTAARGLRPMLLNMDELLAKLTLTGLRRWADFGAKAYRRDFKNLLQYFALESADAKAVLQQERRGVLFVKVQRKLNLYLRSLWGVDFFLRPTGSDHLDSRSYIDQHVLHLPDAVDDIGDVSGLEFYRATVIHMAAHLRYAEKAISAEELSPAQMYFIALFEDARVEYIATQAFPGIGKLWCELLSAAVSKTMASDADAVARASAAKQYSARHTLVLLQQTALMLADSNYAVDDTEVCSIVELWHAEISDRQRDNRLSWQRGIELFNLFASRRAVPSLRMLEQLDLPYRDDNRIVWQFDGYSADRGSDYIPSSQRQVRRKVGLMEMVNEVDNELADDDAQEIWTCADELHPYEDDLSSTQSFNEMWGNEPVSDPYYYSEWDYQLQLSRPDWVSVYERRQPLGDPAQIDAIMTEYKPITHRIRQIIELLTPVGVQRMRNQEDGDEIDLNAAIDAMIAIRMGEQPDSRITMRNVLNERDLAVVVLLDLSESTNDTLRGSEKTVLSLTREAAVLLATAIEGIGDNFALHGFASDGRQDVQYYRYKDFGEHYGDEVRARLAGMQGGLSTRMGAAIRHAGSHLAHQRERRRLVLLVTDGEPADIDERDPQHLRHDAKKAVEQLQSQGVLTYCLTLDEDADRYVKRIFGENNYTIVDNVERLPEQLPSLFASLTG
ncbi:MAG: VWA domain-containing protein [Granulosicoccaceae bacterium]